MLGFLPPCHFPWFVLGSARRDRLGMTCQGAVERGETKNLLLVVMEDRSGPASADG
jgi:hypothetical protein